MGNTYILCLRSQVTWMTVPVMWKPLMTSTTTSFTANFKLCWNPTTSGSTRWGDAGTQHWHKHEGALKAVFPADDRSLSLFLQVNLNKPCPFWTMSSHCGLRDCAVKPCSPVSSTINLSAVNTTETCSLYSQQTDWQKLGPLSQNEVPQEIQSSSHNKVSKILLEKLRNDNVSRGFH